LIIRPFYLSLIAAVLILAGGSVVAVYFFSVLTRPAIFADDASVVIPSGAGQVVISAVLNRKGIDHPLWVMRIEEWRRGDAYLPKAGEFALPKETSLEAAMDIIHDGKSIQHDITIPEGWTSAQIIEAIHNDERLNGVISPLPSEGSMLPETYFFTRGTDRNVLVDRLRQEQELIFALLWTERQDDLPFSTMDEAIVLASIVEKETGLDRERPQVASVFINRLRAGMRLQSDPTTLYGLVRAGLTVGTLKSTHLKHPSPWNTYRHKGLPPTPIANPGRASMRAVLNPADTDFFYFVADGQGGHKFAKTLAEHQKNVRNWRKIKNAKSP
jgi:UPF0755 protein